MDVTSREDPDDIVIYLSGRFDAAAVAERRRWFEAIASDAQKDVCLDLAGVTIMDSAAVGTIAFLFKRLAARQRRLSIAGPQGQPLELLKFLRLDRVITIRGVAPMAMETTAGTRGSRSLMIAGEGDGTKMQVGYEKLDGASGSRSGT